MTACRNGHLLTPANTINRGGGRVRCRLCHNACQARYKKRRRLNPPESLPRIRLPFTPLEPFIVASPLDDAGQAPGARTIAAQCGTTVQKARRWKRTGLTLDEADTAAVRLGCHPCEVWPDWWELVREADAA